MRFLTPDQRRVLRAKAHHLHPVVSVGQQGLTPAVLHEIDVNLLAHELIKIRVMKDERRERDAVLERICAELDAASVQHIGKLVIVWRPAPEGAASLPKVSEKSAAKSVPQVRRPRTPLARAPRRPGARGLGAHIPTKPVGGPASARRRRRGV